MVADEAKEYRHSIEQFFVSWVGTADGGDTGRFDRSTLISTAQQYHWRPGSDTLEFRHYAVLQVILIKDDGVDRLAR